MKKFLVWLMLAVMAISAVGCNNTGDTSGASESVNESVSIEVPTTWPLDGIMVSAKQTSRRVATIDVVPSMTNWSDLKYFAILVYQPSPYAWAFQLAINTMGGGQTVLNQDAPQDSKDFSHNYAMDGTEMWDLQVYYQSLFTIPAAIVNGGAHWIVVPRDVLGLDQEGLVPSAVSSITMRLDISDYNAGIQLVFGKMMVFTEEINEDFSNGITVFNPASTYSDEDFWGLYTLNTYTDELQPNFNEFMNVKRLKVGDEI